jgi:hypothetical protein
MGWAGHVAHMGQKRNAYRVMVGEPEVKRPLADLDIGGRLILNVLINYIECNAMLSRRNSRTFWRNILLRFSGSKSKPSK